MTDRERLSRIICSLRFGDPGTVHASGRKAWESYTDIADAILAAGWVPSKPEAIEDTIEAARRIVAARGTSLDALEGRWLEKDAVTVARALLAIAEPTQDMREMARRVREDMGRCDNYDEALAVLTAGLAAVRATQRREDAEIACNIWKKLGSRPTSLLAECGREVAAAIEGRKP